MNKYLHAFTNTNVYDLVRRKKKTLILYNTREKSSILSFILMSFHDLRFNQLLTFKNQILNFFL